MSLAAQPSAAAPAPALTTKQTLLTAVSAGMPIGLVNCLLASCLREGEVKLMRVPQQEVPSSLASAALPSEQAGEQLLPAQQDELLPNFAGHLTATLPLLEEVRRKFPRFRYRIGIEVVQIEATTKDGFRIETAEPNPQNPLDLQIRASVNGLDLPFIAAFAVLEYLLDRPALLARAAFHLNQNTATGDATPVLQ